MLCSVTVQKTAVQDDVHAENMDYHVVMYVQNAIQQVVQTYQNPDFSDDNNIKEKQLSLILCYV